MPLHPHLVRLRQPPGDLVVDPRPPTTRGRRARWLCAGRRSRCGANAGTRVAGRARRGRPPTPAAAINAQKSHAGCERDARPLPAAR
jgi:hypothetical protein